MSTPTQTEVRQTAEQLVKLLPKGVRTACPVTAILYDHRAIVIGFALPAFGRPQCCRGLLKARDRAANRLQRKVRIKFMGSRALVILASSSQDASPRESVAQPI